MVLFGQKFFCSGKTSSTRAKVVVFGQKLLYLREKLLYSGKTGCKPSIPAKVILFGQKLFYSGKSGLIRAKWL